MTRKVSLGGGELNTASPFQIHTLRVLLYRVFCTTTSKDSTFKGSTRCRRWRWLGACYRASTRYPSRVLWSTMSTDCEQTVITVLTRLNCSSRYLSNRSTAQHDLTALERVTNQRLLGLHAAKRKFRIYETGTLEMGRSKMHGLNDGLIRGPCWTVQISGPCLVRSACPILAWQRCNGAWMRTFGPTWSIELNRSQSASLPHP